MNLCNFGIHDYEQTDCMLRSEIESDVKFHSRHTITYGGFTNAYCKKICLRCGKKVDEISPVYKEFQDKIATQKERQRKAQIIVTKSSRFPNRLPSLF